MASPAVERDGPHWTCIAVVDMRSEITQDPHWKQDRLAHGSEVSARQGPMQRSLLGLYLEKLSSRYREGKIS